MPVKFMNTTATPVNDSLQLTLTWIPVNPSSEFFFVMHFVELQKLQDNQTREFNVMLNGRFLGGPISLTYLVRKTYFSTTPLSGSVLRFVFEKTKNSTLPPILNAAELYEIKPFLQLSTKQSQVDVIVNIKSTYNLNKNWQGDPCTPKNYLWEGVECSYGDNAQPTIVSLNLTSNGLKGNIVASFSNLTSIAILDLSNNQLTGEIPDFFAGLPFLKTLDLSGNQLSGSVPQLLQDKANKGSLSLSLQGNPQLCQSDSCSKKKAVTVVIVASVTLTVILLGASFASWYFFFRTRLGDQKIHSTKPKRKSSDERYSPTAKGRVSQFTYEEVTHITEGFQKQIGEGGFGKVYEGRLQNGIQVAVKVLSVGIIGAVPCIWNCY